VTAHLCIRRTTLSLCGLLRTAELCVLTYLCCQQPLLPQALCALASTISRMHQSPEAHQPIEAHGCGSPPGIAFPPLSHASTWCLACAKQLWCWQVFRRAESDLRRSRPAGQGIDRNMSGKSDTVVASPDTAPSLARMDNSEVLLPLAALFASGAENRAMTLNQLQHVST
jgi:hypothetical protein